MGMYRIYLPLLFFVRLAKCPQFKAKVWRFHMLGAIKWLQTNGNFSIQLNVFGSYRQCKVCNVHERNSILLFWKVIFQNESNQNEQIEMSILWKQSIAIPNSHSLYEPIDYIVFFDYYRCICTHTRRRIWAWALQLSPLLLLYISFSFLMIRLWFHQWKQIPIPFRYLKLFVYYFCLFVANAIIMIHSILVPIFR